VSKDTAIQPIDVKDLAILGQTEAQIEAVRENMEGVTLRFERIKMPSGGGPVFQVPGDGEKLIVAENVVGVIVDHYRVNAYWPNKFSGGNNPPVCSSLDGVTGISTVEDANLGGPCVKCPMNQWGTARDKEGNPTRGKACKNIHRVYIARPGEFLPDLMPMPPTSLKNFDTYMQRLASKGKPFYSVITSVGLTADKNTTGTPYSKATFTRVSDFTADQTKRIREYVLKFRPAMRALTIEAEDYDTSEADQEPAVKPLDTEPF
jgi:hypothetical protein